MAIRFSFLQGFNQGLNSLLSLQQQTFKTQEQIASGSKITSTADDPIAAARIIQLDQEQSKLSQYIDNTNSAENKLVTAETQLEQVSNILLRVRELTVQANGLALSSNDRQGIAVEIDTRLDELFDIANTRDVNGEYIFAGFQGSVQPFERTQTGEFIYNGDDGQRLLPISSSSQISISNSGKTVFMDIDSVNTRIDLTADTANVGSAVVTENSVNDQANYDANSYPEDYIVQFNAGSNAFDVFTQTDILNGGVNTAIFSVPNTGSPVVIDANSTPLAAPTNLGWQVTLTGTPTDGDRYYVNSNAKQDMLTTVAILSEGLKGLSDSPADQVLLQELFSNTLNNLDAAELNVSKIKAGIGAQQNTIESVRSLHEDVQIINREILSDLTDLDYAEAVSRLSFETFALEAAQQSFAKIANLSLFNFIR